MALTCAAVALAGCANLPSSGPTAHDLVKRANASNADIKFQIVDLDAATVGALNGAGDQRQPALSTLARDSRSDLIGPGDVLAISIYEVGVSLFAGGGSREAGAGFDPAAHGENFPAITVDDHGKITLPYLGWLPVAGLTTQDVEVMIEQGLRGKSQDPQAVVTIRQNIANTVYVSGDVRKPGRIELTLAHERLLDVIAVSGGGSDSAEDSIVRFARDGHIIEQRLSSIRSGTADDLILVPGDRIELIKAPRSYTVFGATRVSRIPFGPGGDSLAEAVAEAGGPNDGSADASAIFLFRDGAASPAGGDTRPVIYRLNMLQPSSYLLAQRIAMRDKDVIYIANAGSNQPSKFMGILNLFFSPALSVKQAAQ